MANSGTIGGMPAECLTGELSGIWSGWEVLGDREIVREASAKGTHLDLAYKFLESRRKCTLQEAIVYFSNEVEIWVDSLLKQKQIHRASHILKNVGKTPIDYIKAVCLKCKEPLLREYLVQHVESSFNNAEKEAWNLVNFIAKYEEKFNLHDDLISHKCLEEIINLPESIKNALYTELYFYYYEPNINVCLKNDIVLDFLLTNNNFELIKLWIDLKFNNTENLILNEVEHNEIHLLFTKLEISDAMISSIESSNGMLLLKHLVLNHLSRYGIFTIQERNNVQMILSRFFGECMTLSDIQNILCKPFCNINKKMFFTKLDVLSLSRNYNDGNETEKIEVKNKKLFDSLTDMCNSKNNYKEYLELGIYETIQYLTNDINQFLKDNPFITFTLIFLYYSKRKQVFNEVTFNNIFNNDDGLTTKNIRLPKDVLDTVIFHLPYLKSEIESKIPKIDITMYQLLDGYQKFNSSLFFKWRLKNEAMPDFLNENLRKKFGHKEKLSYINYLREARPNMAANILWLQQEKLSGRISSKTKSQASLCAHIFALRHINDIEVVSSCVSFIEILGISSENLRLHISAAKLVKKELNISIENMLELIVYNNQKELKLVLNYLERSFYSCLNIAMIDNNAEFIEAMRTWEVIIRFAEVHNASLPTSLLKYLASHDAWFEFILVAHIFVYPIDQVTECIQHFENTGLKEHLSLSLNNSKLLKHNLFNDESKIIFGEKNKDNHLSEPSYNQIGVKQSSPYEYSLAEYSKATELCIKPNIPMYTNSILNISAFIDDLWLIILKCHQSQDPPGALLSASRNLKSPILIVLATCYEPSSVSSYCYSWFIISVENMQFTKDYEECLEKQLWSASTVLNLLQNMISNGFVNTLYRGLQIFLPRNPLKIFFEFLTQCIEYGNYSNCGHYLADFISSCSDYKCNKMINWECSDGTYLENVYWIQTAVVKCIIITLENKLRSTCEQIKLLNSLIEFAFHKKLIVDAPNFQSLLEYVTILSKTTISLNFFCFDTTVKIHESEAEIEKCIHELIDLEDYNSALSLSKAANIKASKIILAQYRSEFKRNTDKENIVDLRFWGRCASDFKKYDVCYEKAAEFFVEHADKVKSFKERYEILKLALEILEENSRDRKMCDTVEMAMWKSCILANPENIEIRSKDTVYKKLKTEILSSVSELRVTCSLTEPGEKSAVEVLIGRLLDAGRLDTAFRISVMFNCRNRELQVLMLCLSLAEGEISAYQLTVQQRMLVSDVNRPRKRNNTLRSRGLHRLPSCSPLNLSSSNAKLNDSADDTNATITVQQQEHIDCLSLLIDLIETLDHGVDIGIKIFSCYQLALELGRSYHILLTVNNPMQFLQEIVSSPYDRKLETAQIIITTYQIDNQQVAHFLAEEIVAHITQVIEDGFNEPTAASKYNMNLQSVIELCKDSSLLGLKLLDIAHKLLGHSNGEKRNLVTLKIIIELLIRSHDCFTAACNMEGIASVLRKCQQLANSLQNLKHWNLLVRLVTGVGRFTEMNYIFQILKEQDQFEFLLGRGMDKIPGLQMALLDFVKRHCPKNKELFNMVALHFRVYYEVALMWESEAKTVINNLLISAKKECGRTLYNAHVEIKLTKNEVTEKRLQLALTNLTHATQYFIQDHKLNLANRCSHQAQLVALQIALFNSASPNQQFPSILNLNNDEINKTICRHLNFSQTLILARAYNYHVDWASAIYAHFIIKNDTKYFKDFVTSKQLTASIAIDCGKKYRLAKNVTKSMIENMHVFVEKLQDNECKYMLACQLGFKTIIEEMLNDSAIGAYLKDTVYNKRYISGQFVDEKFLMKR